MCLSCWKKNTQASRGAAPELLGGTQTGLGLGCDSGGLSLELALLCWSGSVLTADRHECWLNSEQPLQPRAALSSGPLHLFVSPPSVKDSISQHKVIWLLVCSSPIYQSGIPWWLSGLRIWWCYCCGAGWISAWPGTSECCRHSEKRKESLSITAENLCFEPFGTWLLILRG